MLHPALGDDPVLYETEPTKYGLKLRQKEDGSCFYLGEAGCTIWDRAPGLCRAFSCVEYVRSGIFATDPLGDPTVTAAGFERLED